MNIDMILTKARQGVDLKVDELVALLSITDKDELQALYDCAYFIKEQYVGKIAYFRGIIECSNLCIKDCYYCGIRRSNDQVERFLMDEDEIFREALWAYEAEYGSCVIQSGERQDEEYISMIERVVGRIKEATKGELGITLSLGEQADNPELYAKIHPADHLLEVRKECLAALRRTGYQVGTGVMMGLPEQTMEDLANDILFLKGVDIDMVGMGPYIPHSDTPMGQEVPPYTDDQKSDVLELGLKMIAVTRIVLKDINIAAATALQALEYTGREQGLRCGANVIMPNVTETDYRPKYQLYDNKPCTDENSSKCRGCLSGRIKGIGETVGFNERGDSPHFHKRTGSSST
jgi:biotin synthase